MITSTGTARRHGTSIAGICIAAPPTHRWRRSCGAAAELAAVRGAGDGQRRTACAAPADSPSTVELYQSAYRNWAGAIQVDDVWTCAARTPADVAAVVNWAAGAGYRARVRGFAHDAPFHVGQERYLLLIGRVWCSWSDRKLWVGAG